MQSRREEKLCGGSRTMLGSRTEYKYISNAYTQPWQPHRITSRRWFFVTGSRIFAVIWTFIFKEEGFVYFSTGISDISKMIQSCFGTLEAPRLQQKVGVKRRFLVEHVWKSCAGPPEMQPWSSSPRRWWQMVRLFWNNLFPGLRACEVLPLHVFEVRSCFLTSCHRATSAASRLLSQTRRLLLLLRACSTVENVCVSWIHGWQRVSTPPSHRACWGQPTASVLQLPLYLFNKKKWKCD